MCYTSARKVIIMKRFFKVLSKPRSLYFSIVTVLTLTCFLMTISFSFFTPTSTNRVELPSIDINNTLSSESENNSFVIPANTEQLIELTVTSNSNVDSVFNIYYETNDSIEYSLVDELDNNLKIGEIKTIKVLFRNISAEDTTLVLKVYNSLVNKDIEVDGTIIR